MKKHNDRKAAVSRRSVLAGVAVGASSIGVSSTPTVAQTPTTEPAGEAQIHRRAIVPRVGQPFRGEYVGQFVLFTDPTPDDEVTPSIVGECDFAEWPPEETRGYQGLLIDRLSDDSKGVTVPMYLDQNKERVELGDAFIVNQVESCSDDFIGVELEDVPVESFNPTYDTGENPLVGEEPGPAVSPAEEEQTAAPGQPGLGAGAALVGIGGAALLRRFLGPP